MALALAMLAIALALASLGLAAPAARAADAPATGGVDLGLGQTQIDEVALPATDMLLATQLPDGTFLDPLRGPVGGSGLTRIVWVALRQASRLSGSEAAMRVAAAERSLAKGTELDQVLPKWILAMVFSDHLQTLLANPASLEREVANLGRLHASGTADLCFQKPGCFNNYVLAGKLLNLELAHTGLRASRPTARLANPHLVVQTLRWMTRALPRTTSETVRIHVPGDGEHAGAALSDPRTYPLAYQALCAAELTRAMYLAGPSAPPAMRRLETAVLWDMVGMTAPNGEISWWGRGQDIVWTMAASFYAAMQGSVLMQREHPDLAARLRRLAQIDLGALRDRLGPPGFRARPIAGAAGGAGIDNYYGPVGTTSLALVWIELAREVAPQVAGALAPLPSEQPGAWTSDLHHAGVLTLRGQAVWLAVSAHRAGDDARSGWGLLRALRRTASDTWQALLPDRPLLPHYRPEAPSGPLLLAAGRALEPRTARALVGSSSIALVGQWGTGTNRQPARWTWSPARQGVELKSSCPRGRRLRFTEWLPAIGPLSLGAGRLARGGFSVHFSLPIAIASAPGRYASAREPALQAYSVTVACSAPSLTVVWSGSEPAPA